ncbi:MAG: hypothetical protein ABFE07_28670 [Armatimonadia bacterium]
MNGIEREVFCFNFQPRVDMDEVETRFFDAIFAGEGLHGGGRVRLGCSYFLKSEDHRFVVAANNEVGKDVLAMFVSLCTNHFGEDAFEVHKGVKRPPTSDETLQN